ncbi:MAG: LPS export ABC transporter periplasmic protein LptC [Nitrospirae bacterium]|nr:LPS export ABC transporter periplasmic protein LptC [Nitrospirota bacterium]
MKSRIGIGFALITALFLSFMLFKRETAAPQSRWKAGSSLEDITIVQQDGNDAKWELRAGRADLGRGMNGADLENIRLEMRGAAPLSITSRAGRYDFAGRSMDFAGDVVIMGGGWSLSTERAGWDSLSGTITSEEPITMEGRTFSVKGSGLSVDVKTQRAKTSAVTCRFNLL